MYSVSPFNVVELHNRLVSERTSTSSSVSQQSIVPCMIGDNVFSAEIY